MSVSVLTDFEVNALATFARDNALLPPGMTATALLRGLSAANVETFNARYRENIKPRRAFKAVSIEGFPIGRTASMFSYNTDWQAVTDVRVARVVKAILAVTYETADHDLVERLNRA